MTDQRGDQRAERDLWNVGEVQGDVTVNNTVNHTVISDARPVPLTITINEARPPIRFWQERQEGQAITAAFRDPNCCLIGIYGAGGYGKSTLAARLFDQVEGFPTKFWANFQQPANFNTFARWLGRKFGHELDEKWTDQQLAQQAVNDLSQKRCLLVLDNVETLILSPQLWQPYHDFLVQWLNAETKGCILLTTQRRVELPTSRWQWQELGGLTDEQGVDLLRQYGIQGEAAELQEFVRLADRHPLLLSLAANALLRRARRDQETASVLMLQRDDLSLFRQITDLHRGDPEASVGAVLDVGYLQLLPHLQVVLRRVSGYRLAAFNLEMAQAMSPEAVLTESDLRSLADGSFLLEKRHSTGWRFSFQPLIQRYFRQILRETNDWETAHQLAVSFFAPKRPNPLPISADRAVEEAAIAASVELFHHFCELQQYATAFDSVVYKTEQQDGLEDFLKRRGFNQVRLAMFERLVQEWQPEAAAELQCYQHALHVTGEALQMVDRREEAMQLYQQVALPLAQQRSDQSAEANTLRAIGDVLQFLDQRDVALERYDQALTLYQQVGDRLGEANTLKAIGDVLQFLKQSSVALERYDQALTLYQQVGARLGEANTLQAIGDVLQFLDQRDVALERYDQALTLYQQVGARLGEANTLRAIGDVLQFLKQSSVALERYDQALTLYQQVGARLGEANTLQAIGDVQSEPQTAMEYFQRAWRLYVQIQDRYSQARLLVTSIGPTQRQLGQPELAIASFQQAAELARAINFPALEEYALAQMQLPPSETAPQTQTRPFLNWQLLIGGAIGLFMGFNLLRGHWQLAAIAGVALLLLRFLRRR